MIRTCMKYEFLETEISEIPGILERAKGFEPSTPTLARLCSTPELRPLWRSGKVIPDG